MTQPLSPGHEPPKEPPSLSEEELAYAESRLVQTRYDLEQLEAALYETLLPVWYWPLSVQRYLGFVEARYRRAQHDYYRLLKAPKSDSDSSPRNHPPPPQRNSVTGREPLTDLGTKFENRLT